MPALSVLLRQSTIMGLLLMPPVLVIKRLLLRRRQTLVLDINRHLLFVDRRMLLLVELLNTSGVNVAVGRRERGGHDGSDDGGGRTTRGANGWHTTETKSYPLCIADCSRG